MKKLKADFTLFKFSVKLYNFCTFIENATGGWTNCTIFFIFRENESWGKPCKTSQFGTALQCRRYFILIKNRSSVHLFQRRPPRGLCNPFPLTQIMPVQHNLLIFFEKGMYAVNPTTIAVFHFAKGLQLIMTKLSKKIAFFAPHCNIWSVMINSGNKNKD